ncbi:deoxyguanosinetriphosphate triphosphohydrolase [Hyphomicrobium sp.]|uniref:deoxyguanosinetriphosphate triphosphohydrolase n=1 Tax=Hyphomicrobium sp. TaxID=82 RepID=UPI002E304295|nr:deoxyguanosinetriphosphate triphosphohydrolase [Hyphomicrobium sp.]HEX2843572.1 deoxyguanosinetriphosphate triphosphohydrolase [Hyphomicrobium sp.]
MGKAEQGIRPSAGGYGAELRPGERAPASYAAGAIPSRGRHFAEPDCPTRSPFQRDRDRVLHSTAFRRLIHKTQVFVFHEGDHFRTRLTHSLEVAQIARTISRQLRLDEDLAEALALAHDLGHPPFGHAGERALDRLMADFGGFDHNAQSLRVVMTLERKYLAFDGLNLTWEALEGLAKHNGPIVDAMHEPVRKVIRRLDAWQSLEPARWASGEAQAAALADDIAYVSHDIDDGLRAGLISLEDLRSAPLAGDIVASLPAAEVAGMRGRLTYEVTRRMITRLISDVVVESRVRLANLAPVSPTDIRAAREGVVAFSTPVMEEIKRLKSFLMQRVYRSPRVMDVMDDAQDVVANLFGRYLSDPATLPETWRVAQRDLSERARARVIADFVAGMTDRYAIDEHRRLFDATPELR